MTGAADMICRPASSMCRHFFRTTMRKRSCRSERGLLIIATSSLVRTPAHLHRWAIFAWHFGDVCRDPSRLAGCKWAASRLHAYTKSTNKSWLGRRVGGLSGLSDHVSTMNALPRSTHPPKIQYLLSLSRKKCANVAKMARGWRHPTDIMAL